MQYRITLRHDGGKVRIVTNASNRDMAIAQVCNAEGAPRSAVLQCVPHVTGRPVVTTGAIAVPTQLKGRYGRRMLRPVERRDYPDGVVVVTAADEHSDRWFSIVWDRRVGTRGGYLIRENHNSASVSALVRLWRSTELYELHRTSNPFTNH